MNLQRYFLFFILLFIIYGNILFLKLYAYDTEFSPSFDRQVVKDPPLDYLAINHKNQSIVKTEEKLPLADIREISYFSDGKILNSTIWSLLPFMTPEYKINYGLFIDSDNNDQTGFRGIDYQYEMSWINETKTWNKRLLEWSSTGEDRTLYEIVNLTDSNNGHYYIPMSLDLKKILYPKEYRILFYAEYEENDILVTDFSTWLYVPPPEIEIEINSTAGQNFMLRQGEEINRELNLKSDYGLEPLVNLSFINNYKDLEIESVNNLIQVPYYGEIFIPVTLKALENASISAHTVIVKAVYTFPEVEFIKRNDIKTNESDVFDFKNIPKQGQVIEKTIKLIVNVDKSFSLSERIGKSWEHIGGPFTFFYGIIAGLSPWIIKEIKRRINKYHKK